LGDKKILWEKRNFGDCKRIFEKAVVEALSAIKIRHLEKFKINISTCRIQTKF
jgi:hypothetical protein